MPHGRKLGKLRKLAIGWRWRWDYLVGTPVPSYYEDDLAATIKRVRRYTLTSAARIAALCDSIEYLTRNGIDGDIVECGVWRGGSMMSAALTLLRLGSTERELYLYDTYTGMTEPGEGDIRSPYDGYSMHKRWRRITGKGGNWAAVPVDDVQAAMESTGYPAARIHCVEGKVEVTLREQAPDRIALLRLDTDWCESTTHELVELYPRLVPGGVLIIDDYGHYEGVKRAVDEYFGERGEAVLLNRIDYTGRLVVKAGLEARTRP